MAQVQQMATASTMIRPNTPPDRLRITNPPRISPSRMPEPLATSPLYRSGHFHLDTFSPVNQNGSFEFDRVIKSGKVLRRIKKKGAWKPSWKPVYLVLRPNLLSVYKNETESELKASITLSEVTAVATVQKTNTDNVFGIFTAAKNFHFSGFNERETSDWITLTRMEARIGDEEELDLPAPGLNTGTTDTLESETTDHSAEDDADRPGSPEAIQWAVRGNKSRSNTQTGQRKLSSLREYSANEQYTTSQSDFSDAAAAGFSTSIPRTKSVISSFPNPLTTIPSDGPLSEPINPNSISQISLQAVLSAPPQLQQQQLDPNRVIRQGRVQMHKTVSGVRQWKSIWAVLRPSGLALYKSTSEYEPLKIIPIHNLIDAAEIDPISKSKRHCFQVIGEAKAYKFNVDNESDLEGWLGALKSVLVKRGRGRGLSTPGLGQPPSLPMPIPAAASERGKENASPVRSPPGTASGRTNQKSDSVTLGNIVEGVSGMNVTSDRGIVGPPR